MTGPRSWRLAAPIVLVAALTGPAVWANGAVDATNWGSGAYSANLLDPAANLYHFDITLTLQTDAVLASLPGAQNGDPTLNWRFTGMM